MLFHRILLLLHIFSSNVFINISQSCDQSYSHDILINGPVHIESCPLSSELFSKSWLTRVAYSLGVHLKLTLA